METLGNGPTESNIGALFVAILGAVIVRLILRAIENPNRR